MNPELKKEIEIELENIEIITTEAINLYKSIGSNKPDNVQKTALSAFASQFYNGIENILKRVHKSFNITLPKGDNWHIQLLSRFSKDSDYETPFKLSDELFSSLNDLRRFRHYFFHGYSINIDWEILKESITDLPDMLTLFKKEIIRL